MTEIEKVLIELGENTVADYFEDTEVGDVSKGIIKGNLHIIEEWRKSGVSERERELVAKLKVRLKEWVKELEDSIKEDGEEFKGYDKVVAELDKAEFFYQLTNWVRDRCWDAEAWMQFVLDTVIEARIQVGDLAGMDT